jgi:hypothetical protein
MVLMVMDPLAGMVTWNHTSPPPIAGTHRGTGFGVAVIVAANGVALSVL